MLFLSWSALSSVPSTSSVCSRWGEGKNSRRVTSKGHTKVRYSHCTKISLAEILSFGHKRPGNISRLHAQEESGWFLVNSPRVPKTLFQEGRRKGGRERGGEEREKERKRKEERKEGKERKRKRGRKRKKEGRAGGREEERRRGKILQMLSCSLQIIHAHISCDAK